MNRPSFYQSNKAIIWAAIISLILAAGIFLKVHDEVTRFTLIMPIFAGFILFSILVTSDEELEGTSDREEDDTKEKDEPMDQEPEKEEKIKHLAKKQKKKKTTRK